MRAVNRQPRLMRERLVETPPAQQYCNQLVASLETTIPSTTSMAINIQKGAPHIHKNSLQQMQMNACRPGGAYIAAAVVFQKFWQFYNWWCPPFFWPVTLKFDGRRCAQLLNHEPSLHKTSLNNSHCKLSLTQRFAWIFQFSRKTWPPDQNIDTGRSRSHIFSWRWALHGTKPSYWILFVTNLQNILPQCQKYCNCLEQKLQI